MLTKEYLQKEIATRIKGIRPGVPTNTDVLIGEMKSILMLVDCLPDDAPLPEDTVLYNKGVAEGRRLESEENKDRDIVFWRGIQYAREMMMKEAVEGEVMDFCFVREVNYSSAKIEFSTIPELKVGNKVRVIVLPKENEK